MGTWGPGHFDSDTSADHLSTVMAKWIQEIDEAMKSPVELEADEYWGWAVPANLELLALVGKQGWVGTMLPDDAKLALWQKTFLAAHLPGFEALKASDDFIRGRKKAILASFAKLRRLNKQRA